MASRVNIRHADTTGVGRHMHIRPAPGCSFAESVVAPWLVGADSLEGVAQRVARFPTRLSPEEFYGLAYSAMLFSRRLEERLIELFAKGYVKGTVAVGVGNEATAVGMSMPLRPGQDVVSLLHRDFAAHLLFGARPYELISQYLANVDSPTHAREGNVHHGHAASRRLPMISHLGKMLSLVVGGTWEARRRGEEVYGLAVIGDGGSSTGEFHEALNLASVRDVPVIFLVENNYYAFSTPTNLQYRCERLSERAGGYGISGQTIDGTDAWAVYSAVCEALEAMRRSPAPFLLECMTLRLHGHAAYDKAEYVSQEEMEQWRHRDPLPATRGKLQEVCGLAEVDLSAWEESVEEAVRAVVSNALKAARPDPRTHRWEVYAPSALRWVKPLTVRKAKNGEAVNRALDYILAHDPDAFLLGQDVGVYGSAFKTCKGLIDRYGPQRVIDLPICESATVGFALGASQTGGKPIVEFQFADFSSEAVSQLGLNVGSWYFRAGRPVPLLVRFPCGGGLTMGAFHSGEHEGLWSRFPGLKILYPATPQETFEALVAGFYDPNPCLVFEHKLLYWSQSGEIDFDGDLRRIWRARKYTEGSDLTLVACGAMVREALAAAAASGRSVEVINPFVLKPLDVEPIAGSVRRTGRLLIVQESGETAGLGDMIISRVLRRGHVPLKSPARLLAAPDVPLPFAPELESYCRPDREEILSGIEQMCEEG